MVPLDLQDRIEIELAASAIQVRCACGLPEDNRNLAYRAADLFLRRALERDIMAGVRIYLEKHIPVAAGLGGGSSDAAAVLLALNDLLEGPFTNAELREMGKGLGADVPFFVFGGPAVACGIGERLSPAVVPRRWYVLVNPGYPVETKTVYSRLSLPLTPADEATIVKWLGSLSSDPATLLHNDLESSTFALHPGLAGLKDSLLAAGAEGALMSGSGPTVFGMFPTEDAARAAADRLRGQDDRWAVWVQVGPSTSRRGEAHGGDRGQGLPGQ
jgi:4-diphosphocytidyl-2-C-methyl-D-erythritol kinase